MGYLNRCQSSNYLSKRPLLRRGLGGLFAVVIIVCIGAFIIGGTRFDADMHNLGYDHPLTEYSEQLLREKTYTNDKTKYFASQGRTMEEAIENFALLDRKLDSLQRLGLVKSYTRTNYPYQPGLCAATPATRAYRGLETILDG